MSRLFPLIPFKVEDHVYQNDAFSELCKDAMRAFNATPVCDLPPPPFKGAGVYAIYCTARSGIYERYGNKVNRTGYNVPIYVGKAVPKGWWQIRTAGLDTLPIAEQVELWMDLVKRSIGLKLEDFHIRAFEVSIDILRGIQLLMLRTYHPLWNRLFASHKTAKALKSSWARIHSVRFRSKADKAVQEEVRKMLEVA